MIIKLFAKIFVWLLRIRERSFGSVVGFDDFPDGFARQRLMMHMDPFWLRHGFWGRNVCYLPNGHPHSARFDHTSKYFQSWLGVYYLTRLFPRKFKSELQQITYFAQAAVSDQLAWLHWYGQRDAKVELIVSSVEKLTTEQQPIYYGEILSNVDDNASGWQMPKWRQKLTQAIMIEVNGAQADARQLIPDNVPTPSRKAVNLFGYVLIHQISARKYVMLYANAELSHKDAVAAELLAAIRSVRLIDN